MASCFSSPTSAPSSECSWSQSPLATEHTLDHHPLHPLSIPQYLSPQASEHVLTAVPPDTPAMVPSVHRPPQSQARTRCRMRSRDTLQLAQPWPQGPPGAPGTAGPGEVSSVLGCATRPPQTGQASPAGPRAPLQVMVASLSGAGCHHWVQGADPGAGCPKAGHGFMAGTMQPVQDVTSSGILQTCHPGVGQQGFEDLYIRGAASTGPVLLPLAWPDDDALCFPRTGSGACASGERCRTQDPALWL